MNFCCCSYDFVQMCASTDANENLVSVDWSSDMHEGETIDLVEWSKREGSSLTILDYSVPQGNVTTVRISGHESGDQLSALITTSYDQVLQRVLSLVDAC